MNPTSTSRLLPLSHTQGPPPTQHLQTSPGVGRCLSNKYLSSTCSHLIPILLQGGCSGLPSPEGGLHCYFTSCFPWGWGSVQEFPWTMESFCLYPLNSVSHGLQLHPGCVLAPGCHFTIRDLQTNPLLGDPTPPPSPQVPGDLNTELNETILPLRAVAPLTADQPSALPFHWGLPPPLPKITF